MARMVPVGMDFCASRRSPERLEPAMMPGERGRCQGWELHRRVSRPAAQQDARWAVCRGMEQALGCTAAGSHVPPAFSHLTRGLRPLKD